MAIDNPSQGRTIEDIMRRAVDIEDAEREALRKLVAVLRDLAVELPEGSSLPLRFAEAAQTIEAFNNGSSPALWGSSVLRRLSWDIAKERKREEEEGEDR